MMSGPQGNYNNAGVYGNQQFRFNNDQFPPPSLSSSMLPNDKNQQNDDRNDIEEFPSSTKSFIGPRMPPPGRMMGNGPSYPNMPPMCFPQGPMNMMDSSPMMMGGIGFNPFWNMNPMGMMPGPRPTPQMPKEVLTFKSSILHPPPPGANLPSTRERPPGCRTAFVGGLPENTTEEHLKEIFERSGEICSIRVSKKNFAHVRFTFQTSVEQALYISGYCIKIDNKEDKANCGRLHVDYATARDDQYENECQQRQWAREMRHQQKIEEERLRPPSPPKAAVYTENEASAIHEQLKNDETMMMATETLITWLERGDCNRKSVNIFYSLLQTINSNVRRLMSEKDTHEEEIRKLQENFRQIFSRILTQFEQIEKVFTTASKQKSWDHFTKAQRKNIDLWSKQIQETRMSQQEEFFNDYQDDSMEMSEGEDGEPGMPVEPPPKKKKSEIDVNMRYENDALKCQLEGYKNEIEMAKQESLNSLEMKDKQIKAFQLAMQGMQQQLIASRQLPNNSEKSSSAKESTEEINEKVNLEKQLEEKDQEIQTLQLALQGIEQTKMTIGSTSQEDTSTPKTADIPESESRSVLRPEDQATPSPMKNATPVSAVSTSQMNNSNELIISKHQLKLIGLISCFLNVHPMGASPDYVWSYLKQMQIAVRASEIEELLEKLPSLFRQEISGCGASLERRWKFTGFHK